MRTHRFTRWHRTIRILSTACTATVVASLPHWTSLLRAQASPSTATFSVISAADDVNEDGGTFDGSGATVWLGNGSSATASYTGLRFTGVTIPAGATILSARLEVNASATQWNQLEFEYGIEATGNSPPFSLTSRPSQRALLAPRVTHVSNDQWLVDTWYPLDDVGSLLQALVNRADWSSGNALAVILRGTDISWSRKFAYSFEGASAKAPRLVVTFQTGSGSDDTTPPIVTSRSPASGATSVSTLTNVTATFSEPVVAATVSMSLRNAGGVVVPAATTYDSATGSATLDPSAELLASQSYTATVSGAADLAGHVMSPVSWSFTTAAAGFQDNPLPFSGLFDPTAIAFAPDGRVYVAEKSGLISVFDNLNDATGTVVADLRTEVHNFWDRGLLGMALHPSFPTVPYAYVLYTRDAVIGGTAPRWGTAGATSDGCPTPPGATTNGCVVSGRLSRVDVTDANLGDEQVLVDDWFQQFPSHSVGSLAFGSDGSLYASAGDAASFIYADYGQTPANPASGDPVNEGGALRAQDLRTSGDPVRLNGSIIRIDPDTGQALPDNPLFSNADANARRIVAYGLRNPFRFTIRPGTRELWIGDVGWGAYEEIDRVPDPIDGIVENFGWPCYEGSGQQGSYSSLSLAICQGLYASPGAVTNPYFAYGQSSQVVSGETCPTGSSSISGVAFYTGSVYPAIYQGALFFADYSRSCIWAMLPGVNGLPDPANRVTIRPGAPGPVQLTSGPGGDIYYVGFDDDRIHRIHYVSSNQAPVAVVQASPTSGPVPLTVSFDGTGSSDPEGEALTYAWDLDGDGAFDDASTPQTTFTYTSSGNVSARLQVTDPHGLSADAAVLIAVNNTPPVPIIDTPTSSFTWKVGDVVAFSGHATDAEQGSLLASSLSWDLNLQHCPSNCHPHPLQQFPGVASGSFPGPDHDYPSWLELTLTATDSGGLQATTSVALYPKTVDLNFATVPTGLQLAVGSTTATTPFTRTVIVGSNNAISAPVTQSLNGHTYEFVSWSDGGGASHNIQAPNTGQTFTATYREISALAINDVTVTEGNAGTVNATFTVTLSAASGQTVTVNYATANGTATAGSDYVAGSGTVTFPAGSTSQTLPVVVTGDTTVEPNESFVVNLSGATNATIADAQGQGTIANDDSAAVPTTATFSVAGAADDVNEDGGTFDGTGATVWLGNGSSATASYTGLRFTGVTIPAGATILSAQLEANASATQWNRLEFEYGIEATGNSPPFSLTSRPSQRALLAPRVTHASNDQWLVDTWYPLDDFGSLLQALVNRSDWSSGNALAVILRGTDISWSRKFAYSFEGASAKAPRLVVTYQTGAPPSLPSLAINEVTVTEGNAGTVNATFTVSLSAASGQTVTVNYATANGTATAGSDYVTGSGTVTFPAGSTGQTVSVVVNGDTTAESHETFFVNLSGATNATLADAQGQGTITNDDGTPSLAINDVTVTEGNAGTVTASFTVSLSAASTQTVTVNYATANGTATAGSDYTGASGSLTFPAGTTAQTASVTVLGDTLDEADETFFLNLTNPLNASITDGQGLGTIADNDPTPSLAINNVTVNEGNGPTATFTVTLSAASGRIVTVNWATANDTATAGADYTAGSGTVTFPAGSTSQPITVAVLGDALDENNETYFVKLSGATNATIADSQGQGTINDKDARPSLAINDVTVTEGNSGSINAIFTVTLTPVSGRQVTISYTTANSTATAGSDYVAISGTLTFPAGVTTQTVSVQVTGDTTVEPNEVFVVNLSTATNATIGAGQGRGTIVNNDP